MGTYIEVEKGVKLYVEDVGKGKPVMFLHGWPLNHQMFEYQFNQLPKFGIRCILPDFRGYGKSDRPWTSYSYSRMADDLFTVIEALKLRDLVLVGFSMGGAIAIHYMARHEGFRVTKLALIGAAAPLATQHIDFPYGQPKEEWDRLISQAYADRPAMIHAVANQFFNHETQGNKGIMDWFFSLALDASGHGTIHSAEALRDEDLRPDLGKIKVPTAILHAVADRICPYSLAEAMHKGIKGSELIPFQHSGHGLFYDEKDKVNKELLRFMRSSSDIRVRIGSEMRTY